MEENNNESSEAKESNKLTKPEDQVSKDTEAETKPEEKESITTTIKKVIKKVTKKLAKKPKPKKVQAKQELNRGKVFRDLNTEFGELQEKVIGLSHKSTGGMALRLNRVSKLLFQSMKMLR